MACRRQRPFRPESGSCLLSVGVTDLAQCPCPADCCDLSPGYHGACLVDRGHAPHAACHCRGLFGSCGSCRSGLGQTLGVCKLIRWSRRSRCVSSCPRKTKKPDHPQAPGFSIEKTGVPSWEPAGKLLLEALDALGSSRMGLMLVVLGAGAQTKCNGHQSHKSNFLHSMVFLSLFRQTGEPRFSRV